MNDQVRLVQMEHAETQARRVEQAAAEAGQSADISLGSAQIALKAAASMPTPQRQGVRENIDSQRLAAKEQSFIARLSPRHRNRWPQVAAFDEQVDGLDRRQEELSGPVSSVFRAGGAKRRTFTSRRTSVATI